MQTEVQPVIEDKVETLGAADIVIGVPSLNNAATIGQVVRAAQEGLRQFFPAARGVVINSDGGSSDGTPAVAAESAEADSKVIQVTHAITPVQKLSTPYLGIPGKGSAIRNVFQLSRRLGAKACAVVDSDLRSITPEWIRLLVEPVLEQGYDFVAPSYVRHKFDGAINTSVVYPMSRALYGKRIRQPMGGEFCFSPKMMDRYLARNVWEAEAAPHGIDLWLTTEAMAGGARLCQTVLGEKVRDPQDSVADLSTVLVEVLGALFAEVDRGSAIWQKVRGSSPVTSFGGAILLETEPVKVEAGKMIDSFRLGCKNLFEIWSKVLPPDSLFELRRHAQRPPDEFRLVDKLWARVVYDFAVAYHFRPVSRDHLLRAFTPLYLGWVASFVMEMETASADQVEARIETLCLQYEAEKPYLISRWRWPDRF